METELAIAMSAREWSDRLHRFLADHGGARVRLNAMGPHDVVAESFDILLIDDICSFLTPRLVDLVERSGRKVIGVYDSIEFPDGKDRLLDCGVAEVIEASAHPDEFLGVIGRIADMVAVRSMDQTDEGSPTVEPSIETRRDRILAVTAPSGGTGTTETAVALAASLASRGADVVLVDGNDLSPSLAQRLDLPLHPNIRTAIDVLEHRTGLVSDLLSQAGHGLHVLAGLPNVRDWSEVRPRQVADVVFELAEATRFVVMDLGSQIESIGFGDGISRFGITHELLRIADRVITVATGDPVGVARLIDWIASARQFAPELGFDILINRAPRDAFRRSEIVEELSRTYRPASLGFLPEDGKLAGWVWNGEPAPRGRFRNAIDGWAGRFVTERVPT